MHLTTIVIDSLARRVVKATGGKMFLVYATSDQARLSGSRICVDDSRIPVDLWYKNVNRYRPEIDRLLSRKEVAQKLMKKNELLAHTIDSLMEFGILPAVRKQNADLINTSPLQSYKCIQVSTLVDKSSQKCKVR